MLEAFKRKLLEDKEIGNALAGGVAGAITATVVCPLDVLKTRLQVQGKAGAAMYKGVGGELLIKPWHPPASSAAAAAARTATHASRAHAAAAQYSYEAVASGGLSKILREEGVRGLYRGLTPTLVALLPNWAVYFSTYERLKTAIGSRVSPQWSTSAGVHMAAAAGAGAATMLITNPLWVIKTRLQTQNMGIRMGASGNPALYRGTLDALMRIAREEGVAGLYSGLGPSLLGVMHVVIQFPLYESLKAHFREQHGDTGDSLNLYELIVASAASKMVASTATYPHEVVRSRMHIAGTGAFTGFARTCRQIMAEDGLPGFYRGCMTNLLRTTPAAAVTFTSFELINRQLKRWAEEPGRAPRPTRSAPSPSTAADRGGSDAWREQQQQQQRGAPLHMQQQQHERRQQPTDDEEQQPRGGGVATPVAQAGAPIAAPLFAAASASSGGAGGGGGPKRDPKQLKSHTRNLDGGD